MEAQKKVVMMGASMRLGDHDCVLSSLGAEIYGRKKIVERHRHRYEVNDEYVRTFEGKGLKVMGRNPKTDLVEVVGLPKHPFYIGCQYHPEFLSKPTQAHPLFSHYIRKSLLRKKKEHIKPKRNVEPLRHPEVRSTEGPPR